MLQRNQNWTKVEIFLDIEVRKEPRNIKLHNLSKVAISQRSYWIYCLPSSFFNCWNIWQRLCHYLQYLSQPFKDSNKLFCSKPGHQWLLCLLYSLPNLDNNIHAKRFGNYKWYEAVLFSWSNWCNRCNTFYLNSPCYNRTWISLSSSTGH